MVYQDVVFHDKVVEKIKKITVELRKIDENVIRQSLIIKDEKVKFVTKILATSNLVLDDSLEQLIYNIIIDHCQKAEQAGPGSFLPTLKLILDLLDGKRFDESVLDYVSSKSFRPQLKQSQEFITKFIDDSQISSLFYDVLEISGIEGKVVFEVSENENAVIELTNGFSFKVQFPFQINFFDKNVKILIIDGNIESISEIHNVLQNAAERKDSMIIVARGMSPDVVNTLKVNFARKTLSVIPAFVRYDLEGINVINDIAIASSTDIISSMKGQLISAIKYDEIKSVEEVECNGKTLTIVNNNAIHAANLQVKMLVEKRYQTSVEQLAVVIDERIKSLTPNCVRVKVPKTRNYASVSEKFDTCLRLQKSIIRFGLTDLTNATNNVVFNNFPKITTVQSVISSVKHALLCFKMITESVVYVVNC